MRLRLSDYKDLVLVSSKRILLCGMGWGVNMGFKFFLANQHFSGVQGPIFRVLVDDPKTRGLTRTTILPIKPRCQVP